jgi:hypothetical protein
MTNVSLALPACAASLEQKEYLDSIIVVPLVVALPLIKGKSHAPFCRNSVRARDHRGCGPFFANLPQSAYLRHGTAQFTFTTVKSN